MSRRNILITGANGGLGNAIARAFLEESEENFLWLGVRKRHERAAKLAESVSAQCKCVDLDVTDPKAWQSALKAIGRVDVLVNNAGTHEDSLLATMQKDSWQRVLSANLDGVFHGCQAVLPDMIAQRNGRIVNIASLSALLSPAGQTNYAAAKAGVVALTQSLAKEVARLGITVNAICPAMCRPKPWMVFPRTSARLRSRKSLCAASADRKKLLPPFGFWLAPKPVTLQALF